MGAESLLNALRTQLGIDLHGTTADGAVTLEAVYCLGNCACAPSVMVDGRVRGRVSANTAAALVSELQGA
jgi:formate dehydrogenase subunit gamma